MVFCFVQWCIKIQTPKKTLYDILLCLYKKKNENHGIKEDKEQYQSLGWTRDSYINSHTNPLAFSKSGDILSYGYQNLCTYNPKGFTEERLPVDVEEHFSDIFLHKNMLVSIKELGEEGT